MAKFFSVDSKAAQFLSRIWDLFILNFLFIIGSLPVITIGVSTIAAYTVTLKMVEDRESSIVRAYFKAYKDNLRQGIILAITFLLAIAAVATDFVLFENIAGNPIIFAIFGFVSAILVLVHFFYAFALAARYKGSLFRYLTNSRTIFFRFYARSLLCTVLIAFELWLFFFNGWLLLYIGVFIAPILIIATISAFAVRFFNAIESENQGGENKEIQDGSDDRQRIEKINGWDTDI